MVLSSSSIAEMHVCDYVNLEYCITIHCIQMQY